MVWNNIRGFLLNELIFIMHVCECVTGARPMVNAKSRANLVYRDVLNGLADDTSDNI